MRKTNRIMMGTVSILLCLVLVTTSVLSGIFAKYVTNRKAEANVTFKKWGITVTPGSDLEESYSKVIDGEDKVVVSSTLSGNLMAPGTRGALAYLHVESEPNDPPEVRYELDFDGKIDIGFGFWSYKSLVEYASYVKGELAIKYPTLSSDEIDAKYNKLLKIKSEIAFVDESGAETGYLPIQLKLRRFDLNSDGSVNTNVTSHKLCLVRLAPNAPKGATVYSADDGLENDYTPYRWCFYGGNSSYGDMWMLENYINEGKYHPYGKDLNYWNYYFDENRVRTDVNNLAINSIYAVEWDWLYHYDTVEEAEANSGISNRYTHTPTDGSLNESAVGDYQTAELDTQLGEAIAKVLRDYHDYSDMFNISLDMSVSVEQIANVPTDTNYDTITFGSYPQTMLNANDDAELISTLASKAVGLTWTQYCVNTTTGEYINFADVEYGGDKYRVLKRTNSSNEIEGPYWFKYEPIEWIVLEEQEGKAFLVSKTFLDMRRYQEGTLDSSGKITASGVPENTYASNWEYSTIRKWLNETFYKTAFNNLQRRLVLDTMVKNSKDTTLATGVNAYASDKQTKEKIFLLSYQEFTNQYSDKLKTVIVQRSTSNVLNTNTDYTSKIYNGVVYSYTRSPFNNKYLVTCVRGYASNKWNSASLELRYEPKGIRPALWISW